ncbi:MAG: hypothetical protein B6D55_05975 [Candidatus Omnitrophica bacterium 4484_70.2]|nr:MAG: hypothetical protein B6D55_05975 [Candidatus Omnitrophica bacterium 4484_70.2]
MKFLVTQELGRLSKWLRILGYDTVYVREENVYSIIMESFKENRIIITKNKRFLQHPGVNVVVLNSNDYRNQLREVIKRLKIPLDSHKMFSRCVICNLELEVVHKKEQVKHKVPQYVYDTHNVFYICRRCQRIYWEGSHWGNVKDTLDKILI